MSKFQILAPQKLLRANLYQLNKNPLECTLSLEPYLQDQIAWQHYGDMVRED